MKCQKERAYSFYEEKYSVLLTEEYTAGTGLCNK
jgi:hypothetical protein